MRYIENGRPPPRLMHAVVFDIDGTLLQSASVDDALYKGAIRSVLGSVHFRASLADYDYVTDAGILTQVLDDNSLPSNLESASAIKSCFVEALRSHISENGPFPEIPGARNILSKLKDSTNHSVAIATGGWRESALLKLESAGLDAFGFPIASSDDAYERKEIMRIALSSLGTNFQSVTYYGDGPWDRDACHELGWQFVAVGPALGGIESYNALGSDCGRQFGKYQ